MQQLWCAGVTHEVGLNMGRNGLPFERDLYVVHCNASGVRVIQGAPCPCSDPMSGLRACYTGLYSSNIVEARVQGSKEDYYADVYHYYFDG